MPKRSLRSQLLAQRRALGHEAWLMSSHLAQQNLLALEEYQRAECIALYAPAHNETDTAEILAAAFKAGKRVLYPAVCGAHMVFRLVEGLHSLQKGTFGILEPCAVGPDHQADEADLIVVPGVAFDRKGHRIGYGKGFYDRFLQHPGLKADLVGLCHDFQLIDNLIPGEQHDIAMEIVVSDRRVIHIAGSNRSRTSGSDSHTGGY
ncbi:MAG: 5-formyltetrahydrofolate cyclo-ligase [Steroidobacteraceae bacterium]|nr:5-formyltetrahydrofolate cyclo-ligase [Deltaproteobacteria bacterium]